MMQWLGEHPDFVTNPVFLGSDSYAGIITPILAQDIINGNLYCTPTSNRAYWIGTFSM
jgi:hypothetical protein